MVVAASVILPMQGTHAAVGFSLGVRVFSAIAIFFPTRPPVGDIFSYAWVYHIFDIGIPWIGYVVYYVQRFWQLSSWDISLSFGMCYDVHP